MTYLKKVKIIIISDGTGETASRVSRAVITQFPNKDIYFTRYKNVITNEQIDSIFSEAAIHHDLVVYTVVDLNIRSYIKERAKVKRVRTLDILGPALTVFSNFFDQGPSNQAGLLHQVNDEYFRRVEAMEFTLNHDDGKKVNSLELADIILVGISRTSKTPLSLYLSLKGYKVINIPLIHETMLPIELESIDQRKIFALTIDPDVLMKIRKERLEKLGGGDQYGKYASPESVVEELEWANNIFKKNKRWPVFNVTYKALEETAAEILKIVSMRKVNVFKEKASKIKNKKSF